MACNIRTGKRLEMNWKRERESSDLCRGLLHLLDFVGIFIPCFCTCFLPVVVFAYMNTIMCTDLMFFIQVPSVPWRCSLGSRKGIWPVKTEWWGTGVVVYREQGVNDLHMVQLMPLPPHHLSLQQNLEWFTKILLLQHNQHFYLDVLVSIRHLHQKKFVQFLLQ